MKMEGKAVMDRDTTKTKVQQMRALKGRTEFALLESPPFPLFPWLMSNEGHKTQ